MSTILPVSKIPDTKISARDRILWTAHDLFYRDGIRATGIDRIIAEAGVTKVTFYRHFPSKNDLVVAYLDYRHARWITWFADALDRHRTAGQPSINVLVPVLQEWFSSSDFRGCAFINAIVEFDGTLPGVLEISRRHKAEVTGLISELLPSSGQPETKAQAVAMAIDGAIVRCQMDGAPIDALKSLDLILRSLAH